MGINEVALLGIKVMFLVSMLPTEGWGQGRGVPSVVLTSLTFVASHLDKVLYLETIQK